MAIKEVLAAADTPAVLQVAELAGGVALGGAVLLAYDVSPLRDRGSNIFPTPSPDAFAAVLDVHRASGIQPVRDISDELVRRALMSDKTIVNYTIDEDLKIALSGMGGSRVFKSKKPYDAVRRAEDILGEHGFKSQHVRVAVPTEHQKDDDVDNQEPGEADVHLLRSEAFPNGLVGYRHSLFSMMLRDGPKSKPPKWDNGSTRTVL